MASIAVQLTRASAKSPWGFRLRGGRDFCSPLIVERVNPGTIAERNGLRAGDHVVAICGQNTRDMLHMEAQTAVRQGGNDLDLELSRDGSAVRSEPVETVYRSPPETPEARQTYSQPKPTVLNANPPPFSTPHFSPEKRVQGTTAPPVPPPAFPQVTKEQRTSQISSQPPWQVQSQKPSSTSAKGPTAAANQSESNIKSTTVTDNNPIPVCGACHNEIRGPYLMAAGKCYCQNHLVCSHCKQSLRETSFAEHDGNLYCEEDYKHLFAPTCAKCAQPVLGDVVNALDRHWHNACFACARCHRPIGGANFLMDDATQNPPVVYCQKDWEELFQSKCNGCGKCIGVAERFLELSGANYHPNCIICSVCKVPLQNRVFSGPGGKLLCQMHAKLASS